MQIFDTHAHYDDAAFDADREALLGSLPEQGVRAVLSAAVDPESARRTLALCRQYPGFLFGAVGIHPEAVGQAPDSWLRDIYTLSADPACRAIGEIGLDYHYEDGAPRAVQREWFRRQLALAQERNLPVVIHDRDAHEDTLKILEEYKPRGVVHCFSGSVEMMRQLTAWGLHIGIGGVVTFKNARRAVEVAAAVPADRLLLETDAPYMAPEPERGQRNHSGRIVHIARRLAEIRGEDPESLCRQTYDNACRLFGVQPTSSPGGSPRA